MNIGKNLYRVCKNDVFIDYDQQNTKKIVTEMKRMVLLWQRIREVG